MATLISDRWKAQGHIDGQAFMRDFAADFTMLCEAGEVAMAAARIKIEAINRALDAGLTPDEAPDRSEAYAVGFMEGANGFFTSLAVPLAVQ